MEYFKYMKIPITMFPQWIIEKYKLEKRVFNGYFHLELRWAVWGLPQVGILANKCVKQKFSPFRYHECKNTPGLWYHDTREITFTLMVDNSGVKYIVKSNVKHLIQV